MQETPRKPRFPASMSDNPGRAGKAPGRAAGKRPPTVAVHLADARNMAAVAQGEAALVVTSPPYPMIAMWDGLFGAAGARGYEGMHELLDGVWREVSRVLMPGGLACVVVGDALRKADGHFRLFPNHSRVTQAFEALGLQAMPYILWKKPTNRPNAFLGSGFSPPNAYVTLDCEFILIFRKGGLRKFPPGDERRRASVYSKAERDVWFSQIWDIKGSRQTQRGLSRRTAGFPPEVPKRLISMFSVTGDLVVDPFAGTGTTLAQAVLLGRRAVGYEWDAAMQGEIERTVEAAGGSCSFDDGGPNG